MILINLTYRPFTQMSLAYGCFGDLELSKAYYYKAIEISGELGLSNENCIIEHALAYSLERCGQTIGLSTQYKKALQLAMKERNKRIEAECLLALAKNDIAVSDFDAAVEKLAACDGILRVDYFPEVILEVYRHFALAYAGLRNKRKACYYRAREIDLKQNIYNLAQSLAIAMAYTSYYEMQYERMVADHIKTLNVQRGIIDAQSRLTMYLAIFSLCFISVLVVLLRQRIKAIDKNATLLDAAVHERVCLLEKWREKVESSRSCLKELLIAAEVKKLQAFDNAGIVGPVNGSTGKNWFIRRYDHKH